MANLSVDTISGIGTEGVVLDGGLKFRSLNYMTLPKGDTTQRGRGRGLFNGGRVGNTVQFINIQSQGNSIDFGDMVTTRNGRESCASPTRAIITGGEDAYSDCDFLTISTLGNAVDFGNLSLGSGYSQGFSNSHGGLG